MKDVVFFLYGKILFFYGSKQGVVSEGGNRRGLSSEKLLSKRLKGLEYGSYCPYLWITCFGCWIAFAGCSKFGPKP